MNGDVAHFGRQLYVCIADAQGLIQLNVEGLQNLEKGKTLCLKDGLHND